MTGSKQMSTDKTDLKGKKVIFMQPGRLSGYLQKNTSYSSSITVIRNNGAYTEPI
jgi:hypothetical protein